MARVAKGDREYYAEVELRRGNTVLSQCAERADSLPALLSRLFPTTDVGKNLQGGKPRELRFEFARHGGEWPSPNFHTIARDIRLAPHVSDRLYGPSPGDVAHYVRVKMWVKDTSAMRAYRHSGFLDDDQIDRAAAQLVGTDRDHTAVLAQLYPGLPLDLWAESISAAQFARVVERDPETNLWRLVP